MPRIYVLLFLSSPFSTPPSINAFQSPSFMYCNVSRRKRIKFVISCYFSRIERERDRERQRVKEGKGRTNSTGTYKLYLLCHHFFKQSVSLAHSLSVSFLLCLSLSIYLFFYLSMCPCIYL